MQPHLSPEIATPIQFTPEQSSHVARVVDTIRKRIERAGGWIPFSDFMRLCLYEPGLGYYAAGAKKFGRGGDFVTAPELTPLFGQTIAGAIAPLLAATTPTILELGAGSGTLARDVLANLATRGVRAKYQILEVSPQLRAMQAETLAVFGTQVSWLDHLPDRIYGVVVANEVLDALPCERMHFRDARSHRVGVVMRDNKFVAKTFTLRTNEMPELEAAQQRLPQIEGYTTEINLEAEALVRSVTQRMHNAAALWFDYGFPQSEYFHPQRRDGTLMCHIQHRNHGDAFFAPGMQDITAHIDFSAMAIAAREGGASQIAYVGQAEWLLEAGLLEALVAIGEPGTARYLTATNAVNTLVSPAEMGELFKVLMVTVGHCPTPRGFTRDQSFRL